VTEAILISQICCVKEAVIDVSYDNITKHLYYFQVSLHLLVFTYRLLVGRNDVCLTMVSPVLIYRS